MVVEVVIVVVERVCVARVVVPVGSAPTVVVAPEPPLSPALINSTAIVAAARNAAGAPYRVSSLRRRGSTYQPETDQTSRA